MIIDVSRLIVNSFLESSNLFVSLAFMFILLVTKVGATIFLFLTIKEGLFGNFTDDKKRVIKICFIIMIVGSIYALSIEFVIVNIVYILVGIIVSSILMKSQEPIIYQQQFPQSI